MLLILVALCCFLMELIEGKFINHANLYTRLNLQSAAEYAIYVTDTRAFIFYWHMAW